MDKKRFQLIVLIIISLFSVLYTLGGCIVLGTWIIVDIQDPQFDFKSVWLLLLGGLSITSVIYAWFNKKLGSILITLSTGLMFLFEIIFRFQFTASIYYMYGGLLLFGLLLLFSEYYPGRF